MAFLETLAVTKKDIVKQISDDMKQTQMVTKEIVQRMFDAIIDTLLEDPKHRIELRNFGVFEVKKRAARKARNPRTGVNVQVEAKYVVTFKPGKEMEEKVRMLEIRDAEQSRKNQEASSPTNQAHLEPPMNQSKLSYNLATGSYTAKAPEDL